MSKPSRAGAVAARKRSDRIASALDAIQLRELLERANADLAAQQNRAAELAAELAKARAAEADARAERDFAKRERDDAQRANNDFLANIDYQDECRRADIERLKEALAQQAMQIAELTGRLRSALREKAGREILRGAREDAFDTANPRATFAGALAHD